MNGLPPIPVTEREDSMRLLYVVLDDANHTFGPPIAKGQKSRFRSVFLGTALFVTLGIFFGVAIGLTRDLEPIAETTRQELLNRITATQEQLAKTQESLATNLELIDLVRDETSTQSREIQRLNENIEILNRNTGYTEIRGNGVKVTIQASVKPSFEEGVDLGVVIDSDIARVVNGLFANGAVAVAVNQYRITSNTAIRSAGEAILVGYQALTPPYEVVAIGNPAAMLKELRTGRTGQDITEISNRYGVRFTFTEVNQATVPESISPLRNRVAVRIIE